MDHISEQLISDAANCSRTEAAVAAMLSTRVAALGLPPHGGAHGILRHAEWVQLSGRQCVQWASCAAAHYQ